MTHNKSIKRLVSMGIIVGMAGIMGLTSFADSTAASTTISTSKSTCSRSACKSKAKIHKMDSTKRLADMKTRLAALVTDGKLTQAKSDAVYNYLVGLTPKSDVKLEKGTSPIDQLAAAGTITADDAAIIKDALRMKGGKGGKGGPGGKGGEMFTDMVKDGIIDQATSDKIKAYMDSHRPTAPTTATTGTTSAN
jgi:hypothetical protein